MEIFGCAISETSFGAGDGGSAHFGTRENAGLSGLSGTKQIPKKKNGRLKALPQ
jgi:hypothetical protein